MQPTKRFWRALLSVPGAATSRFEWQTLLEEEWPLVAPLLRPTGAVVRRVRCPSPGGDGCPRWIVSHGDDRIVAICGDPEGQCDSLELTLDDIVARELDLERLADVLCRLLCLEPESHSLAFAGPVWQVGWYVPVQGQQFAVTLVLPVNGDQLHNAAVRLAGHFARAFLLFAPTRLVIEPATVEYLHTGRSRLVCLEEVLGVGPAGEWQLLCQAEDILRDFRYDVVGEVRFGAPEHRFPTPPGSGWQHVTIRFLNGHEVAPRVRGEGGGAYSYVHMGMAKANKEEPTVQWDLLHAISEGRGELLWPRAVRRRTVQNQRERLTRHLQDFFGIDEDPFEDLRGGRGFKTRFMIAPER